MRGGSDSHHPLHRKRTMRKTGYFEIKDKILYHTSNVTKFSVGEVFTCGDKNTNMYKSVFEKDYKIDGKSIYDVQTGYIPKVKSRKLVRGERINTLNGLIGDYDFTLRELALEEVRKSQFEKYPSRFKSLFVCDCLEDALMWKSKMSWKRSNCQFVTLKCTGKLFVGDSLINRTNNLSYNSSLERAKKYWSGEVTENPRFECLFEGVAEVVDVENFN